MSLSLSFVSFVSLVSLSLESLSFALCQNSCAVMVKCVNAHLFGYNWSRHNAKDKDTKDKDKGQGHERHKGHKRQGQ
jgi:hypothetical protein